MILNKLLLLLLLPFLLPLAPGGANPDDVVGFINYTGTLTSCLYRVIDQSDHDLHLTSSRGSAPQGR